MGPTAPIGRRVVRLVAAATALTLAPGLARADDVTAPRADSVSEPAAPFGTAGQWVVSGSSDIGLQAASYDQSSASDFSATFAPGLDYFVARNLAFGITVDLNYAKGKGYGADGSLVQTTSTTISGGVRMAYNLQLGSRLSLYPRISLGAEAVSRQQQLASGTTLSVGSSAVGAASTEQIGPWAEFYVPLVWQLAPHFFFGFGPSVYRDFGVVQGASGGIGQSTEFGVGFVVGGMWGGAEPVPDVAPAPVPDVTPAPVDDGALPAPARRFGDPHQVVLDSEINAAASVTTYTGTSSSSAGASLEPSVDYFVLDGVSVGAAPVVTYGKSSAIDPTTGGVVTNRTWSCAVEARLGFVARFSGLFSVYARAGLVVGGEGYNETEGSNQNAVTSTLVAVHISAPVLVHPASHFFIGLGPSLYSELTDGYHYPNGVSGQNRETNLGVGLIVGGWL